MPIAQELVDEKALASNMVDFRFVQGTESPPTFHHIAAHLAAIRGDNADQIKGVGHTVYFHPDPVVQYIASHS